MHPFSFEFMQLRQGELPREADRHRTVAGVRSSPTRYRLSPAAILPAIAARFRSPALPPPPGARRAVTTEGGGS